MLAEGFIAFHGFVTYIAMEFRDMVPAFANHVFDQAGVFVCWRFIWFYGMTFRAEEDVLYQSRIHVKMICVYRV